MRKLYPLILAILCLFTFASSKKAYAGSLGKLGIGYVYGSFHKDPVHFSLYRYLLDNPMVVGGDTLQTILTPHPASAEFFLTGDFATTASISLWNNGAVVKVFELGSSYLKSESELESFHKTLYKYLNPALKKGEGYTYKNSSRTYSPASLASLLFTYEANAKIPSASLPTSTMISYWPLFTAKTDNGFYSQALTDPIGNYEDLWFLNALSGRMQMSDSRVLGISGDAVTVVTNKQKKITQPAGLKVSRVASESNAYSDGLKVGDIITHINNTAVSTTLDIRKIIDNNSNIKYTLKVFRGGKSISIVTNTYQSTAWQSLEDKAFYTSLNLLHQYAGELSFYVAEFDKKYAQKKGWATTSGVRIAGLNANTSSRKSVLETDDIVVSLNGLHVADNKGFQKFVDEQLAGQIVKLELIRKGQKMWVEDVIVPKQNHIKLSEGNSFAGMSALSNARFANGKDDPSLFNTLFSGSSKNEVVQYANALLAMNTGSYYLSKNYFKIQGAGMLSTSHADALSNLLDRRRWEAYTLNTIAAARLLQLCNESGAAIMAYQQALQQLQDVHSTPRRVAIMQYYILKRMNEVAVEKDLKNLEKAIAPALLLAGHHSKNENLIYADTAFWRRIQYVGTVSDMAQSKLKEEKKQKLKNTLGALAMAAGTVASYSELGTEIGGEMLMQTANKVTADKENINNVSSQMSATFSSVQVGASFTPSYQNAKGATGTAMASEFLQLAYTLGNQKEIYETLNQRTFLQAFPEARPLLAKIAGGTAPSGVLEDVLAQISALIIAKEQDVFTNELSKL